MDTLELIHLVLSGLIIPVGAIVTQVAYKVAKIENELNSRIVRLETLMEIMLHKGVVNNETH